RVAVWLPLGLEPDRFEGRGMKHLLDANEPAGQSLCMMMPQECLDDMAVRADAIRPEVLAHQFARTLQLLLDEGQRDFGGRSIGEPFEADALCLLECLENRRRQPWMRRDQRFAHSDQVHDREYARALEIVGGRRDRIRE